MNRVLSCRRTGCAVLGMILCAIGMYYGMDTSPAIAAICIGVAGANAAQGMKSKKP